MRWPNNTGPVGGICRECGGSMILQYSDHIYREYTCNQCGLVSSSGGGRKLAPKGEVQLVVDAVYKALAKNNARVTFQPFLGVVAKICVKKCNGHIPVLRKTELNSWGYEIIGEDIIKVK